AEEFQNARVIEAARRGLLEGGPRLDLGAGGELRLAQLAPGLTRGGVHRGRAGQVPDRARGVARERLLPAGEVGAQGALGRLGVAIARSRAPALIAPRSGAGAGRVPAHPASTSAAHIPPRAMRSRRAG